MYVAQAILKIDAEIAEKGRFWTETGLAPLHGGNLAELDGGLPIEKQRLLSTIQGVEGMPPLMEKGPDIAIDAHGVHKDEW